MMVPLLLGARPPWGGLGRPVRGSAALGWARPPDSVSAAAGGGRGRLSPPRCTQVTPTGARRQRVSVGPVHTAARQSHHQHSARVWFEVYQAEVYCKAKHLEVREAELRKQDLFYRQQVARLEERSAQFYKVTTENYHKAADHVNGKFRRYETHPVCAELQGEILKCYQENGGRTLQCSGIAARYLECVDGSKQDKDP
ncbi:unnamed protein product [Boreogadus saida]